MNITINFGPEAKFKRQVTSFKEAAQVLEDAREEGFYGASDMRKDCGVVTDDNSKKIGFISFNGRAWDLEGKEIAL